MTYANTNKHELDYSEFDLKRALQYAVNTESVRIHDLGLAFRMVYDRRIPPLLLGDCLRITNDAKRLLDGAIQRAESGDTIILKAQLVKDDDDGWSIVDISVSNSAKGTSAGFSLVAENIPDNSGDSVTDNEPPADTNDSHDSDNIENTSEVVKPDSADQVDSTAISKRAGNAEKVDAAKDTGNKSARNINNIFAARRILLAEDSAKNRAGFIALLKPTGIKIVCASNGAEAARIFSAAPGKYDLLFLDTQMPILSGCDATELIRALEMPKARTIPIIAMLGNPLTDSVKKCLAAGMNGCIMKPIKLNDVLDVLDRYLKK